MLTFIFLLILHLITSAVSGVTPPYSTTDYILLSCGKSSTSSSLDGRNWIGDSDSLLKFSPSTTHNNSISADASTQGPSVSQTPYTSARIFTTQFTYTFPVSAGPKFLRLYFYPAKYSGGYDMTQSFFSVTANNYTLLRNFSAFLDFSDAYPQVSKEFIINVLDNQSQKLALTFTPNPNSYAFVNGIEIVSMPDTLYRTRADVPTPLVGSNFDFQMDNQTAMETLYRLNVGGKTLSTVDDTGMYRIWRQDDPYLRGYTVGLTPHLDIPINFTASTPAYTAPVIIYTTTRTMGNQNQNLKFNLTWNFIVHSGFYYLVKFHFCEIQKEITKENQRIFSIFINNQTAEKEADVIHWSGGRGIPVYRDYVVFMVDPDGRRSLQHLRVDLHPNMDSAPKYADAILNGLEIFKLNQTDGSLSGANGLS